MNRIEYNNVMKAMEINHPMATIITTNNLYETVYFFECIAINFDGKDSAIINGQIPLEVMKMICEKHSNCMDNYKNQVVDDEYIYLTNKYKEEKLNAFEYHTKCYIAKLEMLRRKDEDKYIETYKILSKENLLIFLMEMKNYIAKKKGISEESIKKKEK